MTSEGGQLGRCEIRDERSYRWIWDQLDRIRQFDSSIRLGEEAVRRGWISFDALGEIVEDLAERKEEGPDASLLHHLLKRGLLTAEQASILGAEPPRPAAPRTLGRYQVHEELGQGGMGVVYRAFDPLTERWVALKVLDGAGRADRFHREASASARLRHEGIITLYDVGKDSDQHFLAMELVDGRPMEEAWLDWPLRERVKALEQVARAVAYAHTMGVVHRDLKPGNVIVGPQRTLKIMDFGLARLEGKPQLTVTGAVMGTPVYMAPEQVKGDAAGIGPATDAWALGVMLYEAMTGRLPFDGDQPHEVFGRILTADPPPPRSLDASLPVELETTCLKLIVKDPSRRSSDLISVADDLKRWLGDEPIPARRRPKRWPWVLAAGAGLAAAVAAFAGWMRPEPPAVELPTVILQATVDRLGEEFDVPAVILLSRTGDLSGTLSVRVSYEGTATQWNDYRLKNGQLSDPVVFSPGEATVELKLYAQPDDYHTEGDETVIVTLAAQEGLILGTPARATIALIDFPGAANLPKVTVEARVPRASHLDATASAFVFSRTGDVTEPLVLTIGLGGDAMGFNDYRTRPDAVGTTLTIPAAQASAVLDILPQPRSYPAADRPLSVFVVVERNYRLAFPHSAEIVIAGTIVDHDAKAGEGGCVLSWPSKPGRRYRVSVNEGSTKPSWPDLHTVSADDSITRWVDPSNDDPAKRRYVVFVID